MLLFDCLVWRVVEHLLFFSEKVWCPRNHDCIVSNSWTSLNLGMSKDWISNMVCFQCSLSNVALFKTCSVQHCMLHSCSAVCQMHVFRIGCVQAWTFQNLIAQMAFNTLHVSHFSVSIQKAVDKTEHTIGFLIIGSCNRWI